MESLLHEINSGWGLSVMSLTNPVLLLPRPGLIPPPTPRDPASNPSGPATQAGRVGRLVAMCKAPRHPAGRSAPRSTGPVQLPGESWDTLPGHQPQGAQEGGGAPGLNWAQ